QDDPDQWWTRDDDDPADENLRCQQHLVRSVQRMRTRTSSSTSLFPHTAEHCPHLLTHYDAKHMDQEAASKNGIRRVRLQVAVGIPRSELRPATEQEVREGVAMILPDQSGYVVRKTPL